MSSEHISPMFSVDDEKPKEAVEPKTKPSSRPTSKPGKKRVRKTPREIALEGILRGLLDIEQLCRANPKYAARYIRMLSQRHGAYIRGEE